jgi:ketosteroid isomerase-like protein
MADMTNQILTVLNAHDVDGFVALFAEDYRSEQPPHPGREFQGAPQVRENWTAVFAGVPDFVAELLSSAESAGVEFGEWRWRGHHTDGSAFEMRGVTVLGVDAGTIQWGRLYMEPVDDVVDSIDDMVVRTYRRQ